MNTSLVIHFNSFTGKLEGGYVMDNATRKPVQRLTAAGLLIYLTNNPDARCLPHVG